VRQHTASMTLSGAIDFNALKDTIRVTANPLDSLGVPITDARIVFTSSDTTIAWVDSSGLVTARANGPAVISGRAPSGVVASTPVMVSQVVAAVTLPHDTLRFESLNAVQRVGAVARDRLG